MEEGIEMTDKWSAWSRLRWWRDSVSIPQPVIKVLGLETDNAVEFEVDGDKVTISKFKEVKDD